MSERAAPHYCPYCGDEDLVPHEGDGEQGSGYAWGCLSCARVFRVKFIGLRSAAFGGADDGRTPRDGNA
ncbi:hypothetical protein [Streptomonospora wellingtoniae]|uniref:Insertion element protein n=1 Tax=Streptomonospora wellingtoniae TaxID=3075544 RepID=A0ABU2L0M1_9ACTN|nr:hypothetical protein [Streptomonospora sp. DSM 45055]MDT0305104.1 hypothetical protein [Streptomonospora sp. DSM 45055]